MAPPTPAFEAQLPLVFEQNRGALRPEARFRVSATGWTGFLCEDGITWSFEGPRSMPQGRVHVAGAGSNNFPLLAPAQPCGNSDEAVYAVFLPNGELLSSTYFGGNGMDAKGATFEANRLRLDVQGNAYLVGRTSSTDLAAVGTFQMTHAPGAGFGIYDGRLAKFSALPASPASATVRSPCVGLAPPQSLKPLDAPVLGSTWNLRVQDPTLSSTSGVGLCFLQISLAPVLPGGGCGLPLPGFGIGGGLGELLISLDPQLLIYSANAPWFAQAAGLGVLFTIPVPCRAILNGPRVYAQGAMAGGGGILLTDAVDGVLGY